MDDMPSSEPVLFEARGNVAVISLNRPDRRNAVDANTCQLLRGAVNQLESDAGLAVGVLRGNGPVFCSGMDLRAFVNGQAEQILFGEGRFGGFVSRQRTKPLIAAVHGAAVAGGFELMLACDLVVSAEGCLFGLPEAKRGLVAGGGGAIRLGEILPPAIANEILLTGEIFDAKRALGLGLVNRMTTESNLIEAAMILAQAIGRNAPLSIQNGLTLAKAARRNQQDLWALNDKVLRDMIASRDAAEGAIAFSEKRSPIWRGN
ncbi:enoyl-CoA hydratase-related protein [Mesorhizobium sp. M0751]|uniref:enoyl-CoA hydratase-related protein n=1 Tax=unclassified Mesorhizobium TaxID=325217 RepID=UPI00333AE8F7